ncbi:MAG: murein biosynthesis integral membrane protein MurJ [Gammaproteobacteria bacterium]
MSLLRSTFTVSSFTLISRISGFVRDIVFANIFGASHVTDAFFVAFKIPNFLRRLFAEGAFSQAFVPVLSDVKNEGDPAVNQLVRDVAGTLAVLLSLITVVAVIAAPFVVMAFTLGGFADNPEKFDLTVEMLRITFPYIVFISLTALVSSVLNVYGRFAIPAFTPVLLNISFILAALFLAPQMDRPVVALAWGVFVAGIVQLSFQLPYLAKLGLLHWPRWGWKQKKVQKIMHLMIPGIIGSSAVQINLLVDLMIASNLQDGSISWLYYSDRLVEFPLGVFGIALATVILPSLSKHHSDSNSQAFSHTLDWALRWVLLISTPALIALIILAGPLISTLFQHGSFTSDSVTMATYSLIAYSSGLIGFIMIKVLSPGYFARKDTRSPVRFSLIAMGVNIILNLTFVYFWSVFNWQGPHAGLALATAIAACINASLLLRGLIVSGIYHRESGWARLMGQVAIACTVMGFVLWFLVGDISQWTGTGVSITSKVLNLSICVLSGITSYFLILKLVGVKFSIFRKPTNS